MMARQKMLIAVRRRRRIEAAWHSNPPIRHFWCSLASTNEAACLGEAPERRRCRSATSSDDSDPPPEGEVCLPDESASCPCPGHEAADIRGFVSRAVPNGHEYGQN